MYWGGTIIDATICDYDSSRKLGLHCPFCNEAVFYRAGFSRRMSDGSIQQVAASFAHYPGLGNECELRASRPEGKAYLDQLEIESRNQRLRLYNKYFIDIVRQSIQVADENANVRTLRKLLGKNFAKPFISQFIKEKIDLKQIQEFAYQNVQEVHQLAELPHLTKTKKREVQEMAQILNSFICSKNILIAHEILLWLQSKSATWSLDRIILFAFIWLCEYHTYVTKTPKHTAVQTFAKSIYQITIQNPSNILAMIYKIIVSIDWQSSLVQCNKD